MKDTMVQDGKYTFMRIEADPDFDGGFETRMITHNQPDLLLKMLLTRENGTACLDYNVTGLSALSSCEDEAAAYLFAVVSGIEKLGGILPEYLLTADAVSLDPERIYVRKETGQVYFCYLPGNTGTFRESIRGMMEFFMKYSAPTDPEEVLLLYGLYQKSREENVLPGTLAAYWRENKRSGPKAAKVFPPIEAPEVSFPDAEIYEEIGMERPGKHDKLFSDTVPTPPDWQDGDREASELPAGTKAKPKNFSLFSAVRKKGNGFGTKTDSPDRLGESSAGIRGFGDENEPKDRKAESFSEKMKDLWGRRKGEIAVAAVVVIGAVLILIR